MRKSHLEAPSKFVIILHSGPVVIFMTIFGLLSGEFEGQSFLSLVLEDKVRSKLHMLFPCDFFFPLVTSGHPMSKLPALPSGIYKYLVSLH